MRIAITISCLIGLLILGLLLMGDTLDKWLLSDDGARWLQDQGHWAGLIGAGLIVCDLFLPVPTTGVMAVLGKIYGGFIGGLYGLLGSMMAGIVAYGLVRALGRKAASRIAGEEGLARLQHFFDHSGAWAIALTRGLPLVPEVLSCLAGLAPMRFSQFFLALVCGCVPLSFVFASFGSFGHERPLATLLISTFVPIVLFPPIWWYIHRSPGQPQVGAAERRVEDPVAPAP